MKYILKTSPIGGATYYYLEDSSFLFAGLAESSIALTLAKDKARVFTLPQDRAELRKVIYDNLGELKLIRV